MKLAELFSGVSPDENWFSCEFFPPKTERGTQNLLKRAKRLADLGARFVSVTWGAGGSSAQESLRLAQRLQEVLGKNVPVVLHLTCTNMSLELLESTLSEIAKPDSGIDNILALRGDRPREDYTTATTNSEFKWAIDLVSYINEHYPGRFSVGVAAYPEGFSDSPTNPQDIAGDLKYLDEKVAAGVDFVFTQLFYDASKYIEFESRLRKQSERLAQIRVIPGLMPVTSYHTLMRSAKLSHATIPDEVAADLREIDTQDDEQVKAYGVKLLSSIIKKLQEHDVHGVHFFTLNLEKSLSQIVQQTGLAHPREGKALVATQAEEASWDDFTNGRYTDPSSAAFGEIDGYGPVVHGAEEGVAHASWGPLNSSGSVAQLFVRHITNEVPVTPFSDRPLSAETSLIQEELIALNKPDMWTIASQPAAFDVKSSDRILGWGPHGGMISQYAFVELFVSAERWETLKEVLQKANGEAADNGSKAPFIWYAGGEKSPIESNSTSDARHVVTWGSWGDKPQVDSTIISADSFTAWRDEAFSVLRNWCALYETDSTEYKVLSTAASNWLLITVICEDMKDTQRLWRVLGVSS